MQWSALDIGWQAAFSAAFEALCEGTNPIGASIVDGQGNLIAIGRNRVEDRHPREGQIHDHQLAHAEINAILQVNEREHPDIRAYTLTTTLEPCPLCLGAIVMGSIRHFRYAARDSYGGSANLTQLSPYIRSKGIRVEGPAEGLEEVMIAINAYSILTRLPERSEEIIGKWTGCPKGVEQGRRLHKTGELESYLKAKCSMSDVFPALSD